MSLKAKVEAIIYAAEEPVTLEQISLLLKDVVLADLAATKENAAIEQADATAEALAAAADAYVADASTEAIDEAALLPDASEATESAVTSESQPTPSEPVSADEPAPVDPGVQPESQAAPQEPAPEAQADNPSDETPQESGSEASAQTPEPASDQPDSVPSAEESTEVSPAPVESSEPAPAESASVVAPETTSRKRQPKKTEQEIAEEKIVRARVREILVELVTDYASEARGMEIRQVAGGFRMATKPEHHDVVRAFAKSLKPPIRLSLAALETLAVVAYKQPITGPEISDIRGVESAGVLGTLLDRKLITTAGRKQVIGRPMQYKTSKDFLLRFGLNDVNELPSMEEFSQLASEGIEIAPSDAAPESASLFEPGASTGAPQDSPETTEGSEAPEIVSSEEIESANEQLSPDLEAQAQQVPESQPSQQPDAAEAADSQPQPEAESSNTPEAEHSLGQK